MIKRSFFYFIFIVFFPSIIWASGEWEIIRDSEQKVELENVKFFNENEGFAYGKNMLFATVNGGKTWSKRYIPGEGMFLTPNDGISAVMNTVYVTKNGGRSWQPVQTDLDQNAWLSNDYWGDLHFINMNEGWATVADKSKSAFVSSIFHTNDGGETWEKQFDGTRVGNRIEFSDLFFLDSKTGWGSGLLISNAYWNVVVGTSDGGKTWFQTIVGDNKFSQGILKVIFMNPKSGWALGRLGDLYHTNDGGHTWKSLPDKVVYAIQFLNEKEGFIAERNSLLHTLDGGETWDEKPINQIFQLLSSDFCFINGNEGWAVGNWGIIHTEGGGDSWETQMGVKLDLWSVSFASPKKGFAVGREALSTEDGLNWQGNGDLGKLIPNGAYMSQIDFINDQTGYSSGGGNLWQTDDGGKTWKIVDQNNPKLIESLCFVDQNNGWILDEISGSIYRTIDRGETWELNLEGENGPKRFTNIYFIDEKNGWSARMSGELYRSKDGGTTWKQIAILPGMPVMRGTMCFANEDMGWIVFDNSSIYHTEDGGERWHLDDQIPDTYIKDICYDGGEHVYAVGSYGLILRYSHPDLKGSKYAVDIEGKLATQWGKQKSEGNDLHEKTDVFQNYPNPFNPETWIPYQLSGDSSVIINIYSTEGLLIRKIDLGIKGAGIYTERNKSAYWDGKDNAGERVASGIYFYTFEAGEFKKTGKMIIDE